eukprot:1037479_1
MVEILLKSHNPNQDHSNLLFAAISGLIPYNDNKDKSLIRHPHCIANQLEKIGLLVNRGWRLDARESGYVAWSKMLLNLNLDQHYCNMICFVHDHMDGAVNFVDQD